MYYFDHISALFKGSLPSQWTSMSQWSDEIVVVTAITPHYDRLVIEHKNEDPEIKFVAFIDTENFNSYGDLPKGIPESLAAQPQTTLNWLFLPICRKFSIPRMNAKIHKILIHEFFPNVKYTVWIDGNIQVETKSIRRLIDHMGNNDIMLFRHSSRNCLYSEAHECMSRLLDNKDKIFAQICKYTQEGFPQGNGLAECPVIIRKNNERTRVFNGAWWDEILTGSSRDQISFPYVQYKTQIEIGYFPGTIQNNEFFNKVSPHDNRLICKDGK